MAEDVARPTSDDDRKGWKEYWTAQGLPWRTEPEISEEQQRYLAERRAISRYIKQGSYPFSDDSKHIVLTRADVEWLLATHKSGTHLGPLSIDDLDQRGIIGLDLAGADLQGIDLSGLPLAGLGKRRYQPALLILEAIFETQEERDNASIRFDHANLSNTHLEGSHLEWAHFEGAKLIGAHLDGARFTHAIFDHATLTTATAVGAMFEDASLKSTNLSNLHGFGANFEGAEMRGAILSSADLRAASFTEAFLQEAKLNSAHLEGASLHKARLQGANLEHANLGADELDETIVKQLQQWKPGEWIDLKRAVGRLSPANLTSAFFDGATNLSGSILGEAGSGVVSVADAQWGSVNLSVVNWATLVPLGDEVYAKWLLKIGSSQAKEALASAIRANTQLASALRSQGMENEADDLAYRAHDLRRKLYRFQGDWRKLLGSQFLHVLAGYGYRPSFTLFWYVFFIIVSTGVYGWQDAVFARAHSPGLLILGTALVDAITAMHGRGFFPSSAESGWQMFTAAFDAIVGLLIEASFIAMFTRRYLSR